jgi:hypothetical protein
VAGGEAAHHVGLQHQHVAPDELEPQRGVDLGHGLGRDQALLVERGAVEQAEVLRQVEVGFVGRGSEHPVGEEHVPLAVRRPPLGVVDHLVAPHQHAAGVETRVPVEERVLGLLIHLQVIRGGVDGRLVRRLHLRLDRRLLLLRARIDEGRPRQSVGRRDLGEGEGDEEKRHDPEASKADPAQRPAAAA